MTEGDFYQLPPVKAIALYTPLTKSDYLYVYRKAGLDVWHAFDTFVELTENARHIIVFLYRLLDSIQVLMQHACVLNNLAEALE